MRIAMASPYPQVAVRPIADAGSGTDTNMPDIFTDTTRDGIYQAGQPQPPPTLVSKINIVAAVSTARSLYMHRPQREQDL